MRIHVFYDHRIEETKIETFENTEWVKLFIGIKFCLKIDGIDSGGDGTSEIEGICAKICSKLKVKIAFFSERMSNSWLYLRWNIKGTVTSDAPSFQDLRGERYFYSRCKYTPLAVSSFEISTETHFHFLRKLHVEYVMNSYWISWKRNVGNGMRACNANFSVRREPASSKRRISSLIRFRLRLRRIYRKFSLTFLMIKKKFDFEILPKFNNRS